MSLTLTRRQNRAPGLSGFPAWVVGVFTVFVLVVYTPAVAAQANTNANDDPAPAALESSPTLELDATDRALGIGAALVPGVLLHGAGHWAIGERDTAYHLLGAEALGLASIVGSLAGLGVTGAAPQFVAPLALTLIAGSALFFSSWFADIYGTATGLESTGLSFDVEPLFELESGHLFVHNPALPDVTHFLESSASARLGKVQLDVRSTNGLDGDNWRLSTGVSWRFIGRTHTRGIAAAQSRHTVDLRIGYLHHRWGELGVFDNFAELELKSRVDLGSLARTLDGAFVNVRGGVAIGAYLYDLDPSVSDSAKLLLGWFGFGMYLGDDPNGYGEVELYYDHRHDGYVAGLKLGGVGSGPAGHFGLRGEYGIWKGLGVGARVEAGSALTTHLSLIYKFGGQR